jgi:hypothetical protein
MHGPQERQFESVPPPYRDHAVPDRTEQYRAHSGVNDELV